MEPLCQMRKRKSTESLFCSPRRSQNQERSRRDPFVFYLLCRDRFLCGPSSASQSVPRRNPSTLRFRAIIVGAPATAVRDFLCARVNTFYGKQKTLNYRAAYYAESLGSNARIRSEGALHDNGNSAAAAAAAVYVSRRLWLYTNDTGNNGTHIPHIEVPINA